jgi:hypothetical protein
MRVRCGTQYAPMPWLPDMSVKAGDALQDLTIRPLLLRSAWRVLPSADMSLPLLPLMNFRHEVAEHCHRHRAQCPAPLVQGPSPQSTAAFASPPCLHSSPSPRANTHHKGRRPSAAAPQPLTPDCSPQPCPYLKLSLPLPRIFMKHRKALPPPRAAGPQPLCPLSPVNSHSSSYTVPSSKPAPTSHNPPQRPSPRFAAAPQP